MLILSNIWKEIMRAFLRWIQGATWVGESVFSNTDHVFQNMGGEPLHRNSQLDMQLQKTKMTFKVYIMMLLP